MVNLRASSQAKKTLPLTRRDARKNHQSKMNNKKHRENSTHEI